MQIKRELVPKSMLNRLLTAADRAGQDDTTFFSGWRTSRPAPPWRPEYVFRVQIGLRTFPNLILLLIAAFYVAGLFTARTPSTKTFMVVMGTALAVWLAANLSQIVWNYRVGQPIALLTWRFLVVVDEEGVAAQPVWEFKNAEICDVLHQGVLRCEFEHGVLAIPFGPDQRAEAETFLQHLRRVATRAQALLADRPLNERIARNEWSHFADEDLLAECPDEVKYGTAKQPERTQADIWRIWRTEAIAGAAAAVVLIFAMPIILDFNAFRYAAKEGTATAYRGYLKEPANLRHREEARRAVATLYDRQIERYLSSGNGLAGAEAFAAMLRYLRDKDLVEVPVTFESESAVRNLTLSGRGHLVSVEPSFAPYRNRERERAVVKRIKDTVGRIFPADIITVDAWRDQEGPRIAVWYRYANLPGSFYYRTSQKALDPSDQTLYHGIEILWKVSLYLPDSTTPVHTFALRSEPAPNFSVRSAGSSEAALAGAVYERMVETAFDDFVRRFNADFLGAAQDVSTAAP